MILPFSASFALVSPTPSPALRSARTIPCWRRSSSTSRRAARSSIGGRSHSSWRAAGQAPPHRPGAGVRPRRDRVSRGSKGAQRLPPFFPRLVHISPGSAIARRHPAGNKTSVETRRHPNRRANRPPPHAALATRSTPAGFLVPRSDQNSRDTGVQVADLAVGFRESKADSRRQRLAETTRFDTTDCPSTRAHRMYEADKDRLKTTRSLHAIEPAATTLPDGALSPTASSQAPGTMSRSTRYDLLTWEGDTSVCILDLRSNS